MKRNTLRKIFIIMLFLGFFWIVPNIVNAAYISVTPSTKNAKPGQAVSVTISSDCIGKVSLSASNGTVSTGSVWVEGSASATVTVGSSGTTTISARAIDMSNSAGNAVSPSGSTTITIASSSSSSGSANSSNSNGSNSGATSNNKSTTKSSVATLSNLGIRPNDFSGFSANKTSYSTEVPNNVESIEIYAEKAKDNNGKTITGQKISGTGKKTLKDGTNSFSIVVTAEDGKTKKTYTINVTRKTKDDNSTENETTEETTNETTSEDEVEDPTAQAFGLTKLSIAGVELQPQFQTDVYEYRIELKENLDKLDIEAIATEENANVEITGNENLQDGENVITILVKGDTEDKNVAYQIIVNKSVENQEETNTNTNKIKNIIIISTVAVLVLIVIIIIVVSKVKNKKNEAFIPYGGVFDDDNSEEINTFGEFNNNVDNSVDSNTNFDVEEDNFEEHIDEKPKKKRSKGKRFK